jgi:hypothetical protein
MPWRGPQEKGEFPTLGFHVGDWIESHLVIPDGYRQGEPYLLTDEMWKFLLHFYRLDPRAKVWPSPIALRYTGGQLRRSQKWGKDPFGAAICWAEALGPTRFDGWDADGEPVGAPYPTPLIVNLGTSEEQTDNTWRPFKEMARRGPVVDLPEVREVGETKIDLTSGGGKIEPATTSARARLGAPMTFVTLTESHLFTLQGGFRKVAGAVKRNVAGMDGRWLELTNAWDPTEGQRGADHGGVEGTDVYIDTVEPKRVEDLSNDEALYRELLRQYGDSARSAGGWVNIRGRIFSECRKVAPRGGPAPVLPERDRGRRVGVRGSDAWDAHAVAGGVAGRYADRARVRRFEVAGRYRADRFAVVGREVVRAADLGAPRRGGVEGPDRRGRQDLLTATFEAYKVAVFFADPYRWQDYLDAWSAKWPTGSSSSRRTSSSGWTRRSSGSRPRSPVTRSTTTAASC